MRKNKSYVNKDFIVFTDSRGKDWYAECLAELVEAQIKKSEGNRIVKHYFFD